MTIKEYMMQLRQQIPSNPTAEDWKKIEPMYSYLRAKLTDTVKQWRDKRIAFVINATHNKDAQLAILFNKDNEPDEYAQYQAFRAAAKGEVDAEIAKLEAQLVNLS